MNRLEIFQEVYGKDYVFTVIELDRLQRVAELIVQECASVVYRTCQDGDALNSKVSITEEEYELFMKLLHIWKHGSPEKTGAFFICGEAGERDQMGLPEHILVCPAYGSDGMAMYTMSKPYSAPGY